MKASEFFREITINISLHDLNKFIKMSENNQNFKLKFNIT